MKNRIVFKVGLRNTRDWEEMSRVLGLPRIYEMQKKYATDQK